MAEKIKYSFKQWCEDNNRQDLLDLWDYDINGFRPEDISYASAKPVYIKCPKGLHESELRKVRTITVGSQNNFICKQCNAERTHDIKDMTGKKFGELTVIGLDEEKTKEMKEAYWICECSCSKIKTIRGAHLRNGAIVTCGNRSIHRIGKNNSNWKGGVTSINIAIRNSEEYDKWRYAVLEKDNFKCVVCGRDHKLEAHHTYPFSDYVNERFNVNFGVTLCYDHHSMYVPGSFHYVYGTYHNNPDQLETYVNDKRRELEITEPFNIYEYMGVGPNFQPAPSSTLYPDELPPDLDPVVINNEETVGIA